MHRFKVAALLLVMAGCKEIEPSGDIFAPRAPAAGSTGWAPAAPTGPQGDYDFEANDRLADEADEDAGLDDILAAYGLEPVAPPVAAPAAAAPSAARFSETSRSAVAMTSLPTMSASFLLASRAASSLVGLVADATPDIFLRLAPASAV